MTTEWEQEQQRVNNILEVVHKKIDRIVQNQSGIKGDIIGIRKTFWNDVTLNFEDASEAIETFTSIKQQAEMLAERERSHNQMDIQLRNLSRLKHSPYFGRFDFQENGEQNEEQIYIGTSSLMDENDENFLIYDWRAPISSLYYDYAAGPAHYETLEGTISGEMTLKRQLIIRNGKLKAMFDTGITIGDEVLQQVLSNQANPQMKSIVATIQKEQNYIIRNERSKVLYVQGVAGSGKTSAALQRIAYLLYRYRETIQSKNIMLFSPNPMFSQYVATVLPELGEDNMQQETFQHYLDSRLGEKYELEDAFSQMEYVLTSKDQDQLIVRKEGIRFKGSNDFLAIIQKYAQFLSSEGMIFKNITFRGESLISAQSIYDYFYSLEAVNSIPNRLEIVKTWLLKELRKIERQEWKKDWVIEEIELLDSDDYQKIFKRLQENQAFSEDTFDDFEREQKALGIEIVNQYFSPIKRRIKNLKFVNIEAVYCQLFRGWAGIEMFTLQLPMHWLSICTDTITKIREKVLNYEDATPYLFLQDQLEGRKPNTQIRHLFIDEAQDYTPFQFAFLKQLFPSSRMTILGDFNQAIFSETMNSMSIFSDQLLAEEKPELITLMKSYRSTREIVEFTKWLLDDGKEIEPINRTGQKPVLIQSTTAQQHQTILLSTIKNLHNNGHETIAIICKTARESEEVYHLVKNSLLDGMRLKLINKDTSSFEKGLLIVPVYLAKGIEFDAVIIHDCSNHQYVNENEKKMLYTACTRAMHELYLLFNGEPSVLLNKVPDYLFELKR